MPLIILVFLAAYIPLVGILVAGAPAILVTLGTKGWIAAVILLGVFLLENQIEGHLLQPLVVGRIVRLHPLAIILVLAVGGIIAGIAGAIVAVPAAAAISYAWPYLRGSPGAARRRLQAARARRGAPARCSCGRGNSAAASGKVTSVDQAGATPERKLVAHAACER